MQGDLRSRDTIKKFFSREIKGRYELNIECVIENFSKTTRRILVTSGAIKI